MSDDKIAWLRAQIEADKAAAEAVYGFWRADANGNLVDTSYAAYLAIGPNGKGIDEATRKHILLHKPPDAVADCNAKLRLLDMHRSAIEGNSHVSENAYEFARRAALEDAVDVIAGGYRHRDGWRPGWDDLPDQ